MAESSTATSSTPTPTPTPTPTEAHGKSPQGSRRRGRPPGRRAADGVIADRETLLTAAERLIRRDGPGASLEAIALEAGVTKPILYRQVGDKDALVRALAERLSARIAVSIEQRIAGAASPREGMRGLVAGYVDCASEDRHLYLFVAAGGNGDDRVEQSLMLADGAARQLAEPIATYRIAHGADPAVTTAWSYGLVGALHFATLWWLRDQPTGVDQVVDQITALVWSGVGLEGRADTGERS